MSTKKVVVPEELLGGEVLLDEIYVTVEDAGSNEPYRSTHDSQADAVDSGPHTGTYVATYKLVKVEKLALIRTVKVQKVKP